MAGPTQETVHVIELAREEASRLGYPFIQREQLFLGLLRDERVGRILESLEVDRNLIRDEVENRLIPGLGAPDDLTTIGMLPTAEQVYLHRAQAAATLLGHTKVKPEHILLGFLLEQHGTVLEILSAQGASKERVMDAIKHFNA